MAAERVIFIVGTPFCGSTILGNCLNAHPDVFFAGEIDRLDVFDRYHDTSPVQHDPGCRICMTAEEYSCPAWPRDFVESLRPLGDLEKYRRIIDRCERRVLVDGSKNINWVNRLHDMGLSIPTMAIICARTPFAYCCSNLGAGGTPVVAAALAYRNYYVHVLRSLAGRGIPSIVVRYEEFGLAPVPTTRRLSAFMNLEHAPGMLTYWEVPVHPIGGNSGAYMRYPNFLERTASGKGKLGPDEAWKRDYYADRPFGGWIEDRWIDQLDDVQVREIMTVPLLSDVASLLGYDLAWFVQERGRVRAQLRPPSSIAADKAA
jgi:hypothetical protein